MARKRVRTNIKNPVQKKKVFTKSVHNKKSEQVLPEIPIEEPIVGLTVLPSMNINGKWYHGKIRVLQSVAGQLRRMMFEYHRNEERRLQDINHGIVEIANLNPDGGIKEKHVQNLYSF